jgi:hypothetical protein
VKILKREEMITYTLISYINNNKIIKYLNHLIKYTKAKLNKL